MSKSCKGLAAELVKCLGESVCIKEEKRTWKECAGEKPPKVPAACVGLRETYAKCKRGQDVTGTLMAYKGELGDYYCMSAKAVGLPCPDYKRVHEGFKSAYTDMDRKFPCFGYGSTLSNMEWWSQCVKNSFAKAGYKYDEDTSEKIFRRIYALFGSTVPYTVFPDAQPFLQWARSKGIIVGIISNAESRYKDIILPALGLNQGSEWDFGVFSGLEGVEKPDPKIYKLALERAGNISANNALHIGDSLRKDYTPATSAGMHGLLLDRFNTPDAKGWKESGIPVLPDLIATKLWILDNCEIDGKSVENGKIVENDVEQVRLI